MTETMAKLAITLHWCSATGPQSTTAICDDCPPKDLIPLLLDGCGLPRQSQGYHLRLDAAVGRRLVDDLPISVGGVRNGSQLWLSPEQPTTQQYCLIRLPTGDAILIPRGGVVLHRAWLLGHLALLAQARLTSTSAGDAEGAAYRWVSRQGHCLIAPGAAGWHITSLQANRLTMLNGVPLIPDQPMPLRHDDQLTLGEAGPVLLISVIEG